MWTTFWIAAAMFSLAAQVGLVVYSVVQNRELRRERLFGRKGE